MTTATNTHYYARADYGPVLDKTTVSTTTSFLNWAASNKEWSSDYKNLVAASTKVTFQHLIAFLFVVKENIARCMNQNLYLITKL